MSDAPDTIPCCVGYGVPIPPNKCEGCEAAALCRHVKQNFTPKQVLHEILSKIESLEELMEV